MTSRPVPNSINLADLVGLPAAKALTETSFADLRDDGLGLFREHLPFWDADSDEPLYMAVELFAAMMYAAQQFFNGQIGQFDPRNLAGTNLDLIGALFGILRKDGEADMPYLIRILNRQVEDDDLGTYIGLIAAMLRYPELNIASAHASIEATNRDVVNCYALKLEGELKEILTDDERAAFASYTAPVDPGAGDQPVTSGYLNARTRANFGRFYRLEPVATVGYTVAVKIFYDDTLHTQSALDPMIRDATIQWAFDQDLIGQELRPRLLEALLIEGEEGIHDAKVTLTTTPVIAADADDVFPPADDRHYQGPRPVERMTDIVITWETL